MFKSSFLFFRLFFFIGLFFGSCNNKPKESKVILVQSPKEIAQKAPGIIKSYLAATEKDSGKLDGLILLPQFELTRKIYEKDESSLIWSKEENWTETADSLAQFILDAKLYGLFPEDYHSRELSVIRKQIEGDSTRKNERRNPALWSKADILLTDAFLQIIKDVKLGRLQSDSITLRKDSVLSDSFYMKQLDRLKSTPLTQLINSYEPAQPGYYSIKAGIKTFLDSADYRSYTKVPWPGTDKNFFKKALQTRLYEADFLMSDSTVADSTQLAEAIKKFQKKKGITVDGKAGEATVRMMNMTDREKFIHIVLSMDKYKMLPEVLPEKYILVNLPGYYMQLWEGDSVKLYSRVVCGKPLTKTPQLNSAISEIITYPQWTIPTSIIVKEILPAAKKNPGYFARKGFSVVDKNGEEVDPYSVEWSKYTKGIPYRVIQGSGDANALGVLKFNFSNKYSVYLHDTNQRSFFSLASRALSHGCVRVQEWQQLAYYILRNDSLVSNGKNGFRLDSLRVWLAKKEKHSIPVRSRLPLFIRYFTCEGKNGQLFFFDDIYGEDKRLKERYLAGK
jgi:murein L,D-transpeptidase YcbB/YkuD